MNIEQAIEEIKQKYEISGRNDIYEINTNFYVHQFEGIILLLIKIENRPFLYDAAATCEYVGPSLEENELKEIATRFSFSFDNWHIIKEYESLSDVDNYIRLLEQVTEIEESKYL